MLLLQAGEASLPGGYGAALLQGLLSLGAVCLLAWVVLRAMSARGFGKGQGRILRVLERVPLDARRSLVVVKVGERTLLIGTGEGSPPSLIAELDLDGLPEPEPTKSFGEVLARVRGERDD